MGRPDGFMLYQRKDNNARDPGERIQDYNEFHLPLKEEERRHQSARCMNCGIPFCQSALQLKGMVTGCPLHNLIPEWNDAVFRNNPSHALDRLLKMSSFPEFTSRVCPALCEKACVCGIYDSPVTIHENEHYIIEYAFAHGLMKPRIPTLRSGKKVAVVGSGPAGLAAADRLNQRGHSVTIYERDDRIGGLLMYGIPNMKLEKSVIDRRRKLMEAEGIIFKTGTNISVDIKAEDLLSTYDAVILACGAKQARSLKAEGMDKCSEVYYAVDFLTSTTRSLLDNHFKEGSYISAKDKNVVIIGGGDTGNDCTATCIRHGCKSVTQIEMMPCPPVERTADNAWPEWPRILKTDYGQEEAIVRFGHDPRVYETTVRKLITRENHLRAVQTVKVRFENRQMHEIPGSEKEIPCDMLIIAAGFTGCEKYTADAFHTTLTSRSTIQTEPGHYHTTIDKVFTAGDMHRGQSLVVWAIAEGRACAKETDEYLMGYTNLE